MDSVEFLNLYFLISDECFERVSPQFWGQSTFLFEKINTSSKSLFYGIETEGFFGWNLFKITIKVKLVCYALSVVEQQNK
jgi:hypothetical protein